MLHSEARNPFVAIDATPLFISRLFCVALLASVTLVGMTSRNVDLAYLASSLTLIAITLYPLYVGRSDFGYLHPLVLASALAAVQFMTSEFRVLAYGIDYHVALRGLSKRQLTELATLVNLITAFSVFCTYLGYAIGPKRSFISVLTWRNPPPKRAFLFLAVWVIVSLVALGLMVAASGGVSGHLKNMARSRTTKVYVQESGLIGVYAAVVQSVVFIPVMYGAVVPLRRKVIPFVLFTFLAMATAYLINGRRSAVIPPILGAFSIWTLRVGRPPIKSTAVVALLLIVFVAMGGAFRRSNWTRSKHVDLDFFQGRSVAELFKNGLNEMSSRVGAGGAIFPIVHRVPDEVDFNYGRSYIENMYRFVPRAIWPSKPRGVGVECASIFYGREGFGVPPGAVGEAYWSLHLPGVAVVFTAFGAFLRLVANTFVHFRGSAAATAAYLFTVFRLGPDQISFRVWIFTMVPALAYFLLIGAVRFGAGNKRL